MTGDRSQRQTRLAISVLAGCGQLQYNTPSRRRRTPNGSAGPIDRLMAYPLSWNRIRSRQGDKMHYKRLLDRWAENGCLVSWRSLLWAKRRFHRVITLVCTFNTIYIYKLQGQIHLNTRCIELTQRSFNSVFLPF